MFKDASGKIILNIDQRLTNITRQEKELKVTESEFFDTIKAYKLDEALEQLAIISKKIFNEEYPEEYHRLGRGGVRHPSGVFLTQFAIEYLSSAFILSGSNNWKSESVKDKDNLLGLFNIYQSGIIQKITKEKFSIISLLVPMYFQQFISQAEPKDVFTRQWYVFYKMNTRFAEKSFDNLNDVLLKETGLSILEYTKLSFVIFATVINYPRFNIGKLTGADIVGLNDVLSEEKMNAFLKVVSSTYEDFRKLDGRINNDLDPIYTKTRFNPLWLKPIIKMGDNDFLAPSVTAYITSTFKGLFWWFDAYFRKQSRKKGDDFRKYFGSLFEEYVGDVIKDIYTKAEVSPQISYGSKKSSGLFFDWIVATKDKVFLFEVKGYQFPLEVLQKGDPDNLRKEVTNKIIKTIVQMYRRIKDVDSFEELKHLRGKNLIPIGIFYDIPFISTPMYKENILPALADLENKYKGIKDFKYFLIGIEEFENYYYVSEKEDIDTILEKVSNSHQLGFNEEVSKIYKNAPTRGKNLLDRTFNEYCSKVVGIKDNQYAKENK